jgi:hypothetical protein
MTIISTLFFKDLFDHKRLTGSCPGFLFRTSHGLKKPSTGRVPFIKANFFMGLQMQWMGGGEILVDFWSQSARIMSILTDSPNKTDGG